jgi:hypothetical protein
MSGGNGWSEKEVRAAVSAYFKALHAEQAGKTVNKAKVYRQLSDQHPGRTAKAFELKFQNISAILYEQRLPYCTGLKPRQNYQRLLRLMVLDQLDRSPLPAVEPHEILSAKLRELAKRGPIPVTKSGSGRFGLAIEEALGIRQNSDKAADFMGIELKTKTDKSLQTLFSRKPTRYAGGIDKKEMFDRHSYVDTARGRRALYTSFSQKPDSLGFRLAVDGQVIRIERNSQTVLEYDAEDIEAALLSKHSQTAFVSVKRLTKDGSQFCAVERLHFCKWPSIIRFLQLISSGDVFLDFTMSRAAHGGVKDHGFLWRVRSESLERLYLHGQLFDLL